MKTPERTHLSAEPEPCPTCGQRDALIALGQRIDHPYRWRRWATAIIDMYVCNRCDALLEVGQRTNGLAAQRVG